MSPTVVAAPGQPPHLHTAPTNSTIATNNSTSSPSPAVVSSPPPVHTNCQLHQLQKPSSTTPADCSRRLQQNGADGSAENATEEQRQQQQFPSAASANIADAYEANTSSPSRSPPMITEPIQTKPFPIRGGSCFCCVNLVVSYCVWLQHAQQFSHTHDFGSSNWGVPFAGTSSTRRVDALCFVWRGFSLRTTTQPLDYTILWACRDDSQSV